MRVSIADDQGRARQFWKNFLLSNELYCQSPWELETALEAVNCKLASVAHEDFPFLEFDTEQDYVMFVLRWS